MCRQVRELYPQDLQDGLERSSFSSSPPGVGACTSTGLSCAEEEPAWCKAGGYITCVVGNLNSCSSSFLDLESTLL